MKVNVSNDLKMVRARVDKNENVMRLKKTQNKNHSN